MIDNALELKVVDGNGNTQSDGRPMATAPFRRRATRRVMVGGIPVGGDAPISVQTMTKTKTADVEATVAQILRCRECGATLEPVTDAPCERRTAHVAYIVAADSANAQGTSHNDGTYTMFINVTDQNIERGENANPVITLRKRYDAWKASRR